MSDEDELVDQKFEVEERCAVKCIRQHAEYKACTERVKNDTTGEAHCTGQYFDYWKCIDKCAAAPLFSTLK